MVIERMPLEEKKGFHSIMVLAISFGNDNSSIHFPINIILIDSFAHKGLI